MVDELVSRIVANVSLVTNNYEIILVEDGGPDRSWDLIAEHCAKNPKIIGIKLS